MLSFLGYHGSTNVRQLLNEGPRIERCDSGRQLGRGLYTTPNLAVAQYFSYLNSTGGIVEVWIDKIDQLRLFDVQKVFKPHNINSVWIDDEVTESWCMDNDLIRHGLNIAFTRFNNEIQVKVSPRAFNRIVLRWYT